MEKDYNKYVAQVKGMNELFAESVKKKANELNQKMTDWRYSERGREELKQKAYSELNAVCDNMNGLIREAVKHYCSDFTIALPDDGKDHATDIQNALRIIDMLGYNLDVKNLENILLPLRGSYRNMKTVLDVMRVKNEAASINTYSPEVMAMVDEYTGINTHVSDFLDIMANIEQIIESPAGYRFEASQYSNMTLIDITDVIPYSFLSCPDWMQEAGKMYAELENTFSALFGNHVPTDREMIESTLGSPLGRQ